MEAHGNIGNEIYILEESIWNRYIEIDTLWYIQENSYDN